MTYGQNSGQIRTELAALLRQHRIQQRLGGRGSYTIRETTTVHEREELGQLIRRYRYAALGWCLQAAVVSVPDLTPVGVSMRSRTPAVELHHRLDQSITLADGRLPTLEDLSTPQEFRMVESWRIVARAAALGEHDLAGPMDRGRLSAAERRTVLTDAADVIRALVVLDIRYENIPRWIPIPERGWLDRAARTCAAAAALDEPDYTVDNKGWRPPRATIDGPPEPGIGGVLQAQHNMLVHLHRFPNALNLRRVMDGQRILSHEAARLAPTIAPHLGDHWLEREQTYRHLLQASRNIGGLVGNGGLAAAEAANAVSRLRHLNTAEVNNPEPLHELDRLFTRTDARVAAIIERGAAERLYFVSAKVPRLIENSGHLVSPIRERFAPINSPAQADLVEIARTHLRPAVIVSGSSVSAHESRKELRESIDHRPERRPEPRSR